MRALASCAPLHPSTRCDTNRSTREVWQIFPADARNPAVRHTDPRFRQSHQRRTRARRLPSHDYGRQSACPTITNPPMQSSILRTSRWQTCARRRQERIARRALSIAEAARRRRARWFCDDGRRVSPASGKRGPGEQAEDHFYAVQPRGPDRVVVARPRGAGSRPGNTASSRPPRRNPGGLRTAVRATGARARTRRPILSHCRGSA